MKLVALLLLVALASTAAAPQMIIGQSVMEAFRAAIEAEVASDAAEGAPEVAPVEVVPAVPSAVAPAVEVVLAVPSVDVPVVEAVSAVSSIDAPAVKEPAADVLPRHLQPIVAIILPADSELPVVTSALEKITPAPAPPSTVAPTPTSAPDPAQAVSPAPTSAPAPAIVVVPTPAPAPAVLVPEESPTAELEQAAAVSAAQVDQSIAQESVSHGVPAPAATGRSLDSPAPDTAAAVAPTVVPILMDEREPIVGNAFGFSFRSGDGQFRSEKSTLKTFPPGAVASPNALPEYETVGEYSFTHPDGTLHRVTYTAGINGYVATGNMLPTPPPMPIWALEQIQFAEEQKRLQAVAASVKSEAPASESAAPVSESADASAALADTAAGEPTTRTEDIAVQVEEAPATVGEATAAAADATGAPDSSPAATV